MQNGSSNRQGYGLNCWLNPMQLFRVPGLQGLKLDIPSSPFTNIRVMSLAFFWQVSSPVLLFQTCLFTNTKMLSQPGNLQL